MARGVKLDLEAVRTEYVEGTATDDGIKYLTLRELATKHKVGHSQLRRVAANERWSEEKAAVQRMVEVQRREERVAALSALSVEFDSQTLNGAQAGVRAVWRRLTDMLVESTPVEQRSPDLRAVPYRALSAKEASALASALLKFQTIGKRALGESESTSRVEMTGAGGGPIERVDVHAVLTAYDPERMGKFVSKLVESGMLDGYDPDEEVIDVASHDARAGADRPLPEDDA
jgi:hypothetical protein